MSSKGSEDDLMDLLMSAATSSQSSTVAEDAETRAKKEVIA